MRRPRWIRCSHSDARGPQSSPGTSAAGSCGRQCGAGNGAWRGRLRPCPPSRTCPIAGRKAAGRIPERGGPSRNRPCRGRRKRRGRAGRAGPCPCGPCRGCPCRGGQSASPQPPEQISPCAGPAKPAQLRCFGRTCSPDDPVRRRLRPNGGRLGPPCRSVTAFRRNPSSRPQPIGGFPRSGRRGHSAIPAPICVPNRARHPDRGQAARALRAAGAGGSTPRPAAGGPRCGRLRPQAFAQAAPHGCRHSPDHPLALKSRPAGHTLPAGIAPECRSK